MLYPLMKIMERNDLARKIIINKFVIKIIEKNEN